MPEAKIWIFLGLMAVFGAFLLVAILSARRQALAQVRACEASLAEWGFAAEPCRDGHGRCFLRVWGPLEHAVALRLRIASRVAGLGVSDLRTGHRAFDRGYRVRTRDPDRARLILDPETLEAVVALGKLDFRLGSEDSLLPPTHWSGGGADRKLRALWMIRIKGKPGRTPPEDAVAALGRRLATSVCKHSLPPLTPDRRAHETTRAEGQWL